MYNLLFLIRFFILLLLHTLVLNDNATMESDLESEWSKIPVLILNSSISGIIETFSLLCSHFNSNFQRWLKNVQNVLKITLQ